MSEARNELSLRCTCGRVQLIVDQPSPASMARLICNCAGCQAFAERMDPDLLDERGGTERLSVNPAAVSVRSGREALRCMQQTKGGAHRWYADCCHATLGLTLPTSTVPFVGLDAKRADLGQLGDKTLDDVAGPVFARVNGSFDRRERRSLRADVRSLIALLVHLAPLTWRWWRRGDQRRSPFFDAKTGSPPVEVERTYEEHRGLLQAAGCR